MLATRLQPSLLSFALVATTPITVAAERLLAGGRVTVCTQCARRRDVGESDVLPGVRVAGAPTALVCRPTA